MKATKYINTFLMGLAILLGLAGFIHYGFWWLAALVTLFLGLFQGIIGFVLFLDKPFSTRFQLYMIGLLVFVGLCLLPWEYAWVIIPIPLSFYFTFMLRTINPEKL